MKNSPFIKALFTTILLGSLLSPNIRANELTLEQILNKELLLNQLMTSIHLLQLDFQNQQVREKLRQNLEEINALIDKLPKEASDDESKELLLTIQSLWPVISRHTRWIMSLPEQSRPPETQTLMRALAKLDRQLLLLRQKTLSLNPEASHNLRFTAHALHMQRIAREYLSLTLTRDNAENTLSGQLQLQTMATHFEQQLEKMIAEMRHNPHANSPLQQCRTTWRYISRSITEFPEQMVPATIVRYNDRIVSKLSSVQRML